MNKKSKASIFLKSKNQQVVKKVYGDLFYALLEIISRHNPMGFLYLDDFSDEYDPETPFILMQLHNGLTQKQVLEIVYNDFKYWF